MISVAEAKKIIREQVIVLPPKPMPVSGSLGLLLANDVLAGVDIPAFPQSSMDGYAFAFDDWEAGKTLPLSGVIAAGDASNAALQDGTAVRIFTGAAVPRG